MSKMSRRQSREIIRRYVSAKITTLKPTVRERNIIRSNGVDYIRHNLHAVCIYVGRGSIRLKDERAMPLLPFIFEA